VKDKRQLVTLSIIGVLGESRARLASRWTKGDG
jgi:hypothetical protein